MEKSRNKGGMHFIVLGYIPMLSKKKVGVFSL